MKVSLCDGVAPNQVLGRTIMSSEGRRFLSSSLYVVAASRVSLSLFLMVFRFGTIDPPFNAF